MAANLLCGRVCVVTSASSQVGRVVVSTLKELGASVLCHHNTHPPNTQEENNFFVDLGSREGVSELVSQVRKCTDHVDLIAHCSGHELPTTTTTPKPLTKIPIKSLEETMRLKFRATLQLYQGLHPLLLLSPSPQFLFPLSPQTQQLLLGEGGKGEGGDVLAVSGFAMEGLRRALEVSCEGEGIAFTSFLADPSASPEDIALSIRQALKIPQIISKK